VITNLYDLTIAEELLDGVHGWALGDRASWSPVWAGCWPIRACGAGAAVPLRQQTGAPLPSWVTQHRRRIETVIGQLVERDHARRVWARDAWHLWSRWQRKLLSHTLDVDLCEQHGLGSLRFAELLSN
jgi:hypothetical protein